MIAPKMADSILNSENGSYVSLHATEPIHPSPKNKTILRKIKCILCERFFGLGGIGKAPKQIVQWV